MTKKQFIELHLNLKVNVPKTLEKNPFPSETDPTQDIPIKAIQITASGIPINVKQYDSVMSGVKVEQFTTLEKRNYDIFDNVGELQSISKNMNKSGVSTDFKQNKKHTFKVKD